MWHAFQLTNVATLSALRVHLLCRHAGLALVGEPEPKVAKPFASVKSCRKPSLHRWPAKVERQLLGWATALQASYKDSNTTRKKRSLSAWQTRKSDLTGYKTFVSLRPLTSTRVRSERTSRR